jgi:hypothetical protein
MRFLVCVAFLVSVLGACHAPVGVKNRSIAPDSTQQCASQCGEIGLALDSVVIMAESIGCVCRPAATPASPTAGPTGAAAGGVAAIMLQQEAATVQANAAASTH